MRATPGLPEFKTIVVGDTAVGKTSIIMRFYHNIFLPVHQQTVSGSFVTKRVDRPWGPCNLNLWDTAGQERYRALVPMYCRGASVVLIVFDISDEQTFAGLDAWYLQVKGTTPDACTVILVGNKLDLPRAVAPEKIDEWAAARGVRAFAVSALDGSGIERLFKEVTDSLVGDVATKMENIVEQNPGSHACC